MPQLDPSSLVAALIAAFDDNNAVAHLVSNASRNPRRLIVQYESNTMEVWVFIWTLTHGGGAARPRDEFRIQITGVRPPLETNPQGPTLLLGYEPNLGCFAGFDVNKHQTFSTRSPSIQIPITVLHEALQHGLSFITKGNDEIAIGIRPDQLLNYTINAAVLHQEGANATMVDLLTRVSSLEDVSGEELALIPPERSRVVSEVSRLSRDSSFRHKILLAYDRRCAVTRMQLRLVEAAHILPVGAEGSSDDVRNGLCLSPTYHRAFDRALIYLDESLRMQINPAKEQELISANLAGGIAEFKAALGTRVHLPADRTQWPTAAIIQAANSFRRVF
ncbi:MAG: HNH endonuclease [Anaerolineae bacterium]|nr:HNH endonuclease [Anaerolineae bacterium]MCB9130911.1 HNH endonuclease [Anaerolineales bacterium]